MRSNQRTASKNPAPAAARAFTSPLFRQPSMAHHAGPMNPVSVLRPDRTRKRPAPHLALQIGRLGGQPQRFPPHGADPRRGSRPASAASRPRAPALRSYGVFAAVQVLSGRKQPFGRSRLLGDGALFALRMQAASFCGLCLKRSRQMATALRGTTLIRPR